MPPCRATLVVFKQYFAPPLPHDRIHLASVCVVPPTTGLAREMFANCALRSALRIIPSRFTTSIFRLVYPAFLGTANQYRSMSSSGEKKQTIAIIGSGTIGLSFAALHLVQNPTCTVTVFDTRPDLYEYITDKLPGYILSACSESYQDRLTLAPTLQKAVEYADIIQEQGPEKVDFKKSLWAEVEKHARSDALLWTSTSGIPASVQSENMRDKSRLMVVHPYNPPHIMPLLEVVPSPTTSQANINKCLKYWRSLGRTPVVIKKECTGFVANRLAFALFREACSLVAQDVVDVKDLDAIVTTSMGPRWSVAGPFKAYHAGGGDGGLYSFFDKIGGTVQECWDKSEKDYEKYDIEVGEDKKWQQKVCKQSEDEYKVVDTRERDLKTRKVLQATAAVEK